MNAVTRIVSADSEAAVDEIRAMFLEYGRSLDFYLCFEDFETELAGLPGPYAPPSGRLLLAGGGENMAGCVALRDCGGGVCEMCRLYVRPAFLGRGIGRTLAEAAIVAARDEGYTAMRLETLPSMTEALALYAKLGFRDVSKPGDVPIIRQLDLGR